MTNTPRCDRRYDFSIYLCSVVDHFDSALYGFLTPLLAPLFFPDHDPITQLILGYSVLGTSVLTRPLGALLFGNLAHRAGPHTAIQASLLGLMVTLLFLPLLPLHAEIGAWAPCLLIGLRMSKGIFAAGEAAITKLLILEGKAPDKAFKASYRYQYTTLVGIIAASAVSTMIFYAHETAPYLWRLAFLVGFLGSLFAFGLRRRHQPPKTVSTSNTQPLWALSQVGPLVRRQKKVFFMIALLSGLSYVTYAFPFVLMNTLIPLISRITLDEMMAMTTSLLVLDLLLIPLLGRHLRRFPYQKIMTLACAMLILGPPLLFYRMPDHSLLYVAFIRIWIIFWGVVFMCPLNLCIQNLLKGSEKFLIHGIAASFGASTLGRLCPAVGLYIWQITHAGWAPALYLSCIALLALTALGMTSRLPTTQAQPPEAA